MDVACGQCLGCRLDYSRVWAMRIIHECDLHEMDKGNCFITLTYAPECMPGDWSLVRQDFVKFMKRLRKFFPQKIRYFMCGEYGSMCRHDIKVDLCECCNVGRPHYHAILFNCFFDDSECIGVSDATKEPIYTSATLERIWNKGLVQVGEANFQSAAYVARYCLKKVNGKKAKDWYMHIDEYGCVHFLEPEYSTMSRGRKPDGGIGKRWYDEFKSDVYPSGRVPVPGVGVLRSVPRYYDKLLESEDEGLLAEVKKLREAFMAEHGEDYTPARLMDRYKVKKAQVELLERKL